MTYPVLGAELTKNLLEPYSIHCTLISEHTEYMTAAILSSLGFPI